MSKYTASIVQRLLVATVFCLTAFSAGYGQIYNDGPIQLQARLRQFNLTFPETDVAFFGIVGQPDDLTYHLWFRDAADLDGVVANGGWGAGSGCLTEGYVLPLNDWNLVLFNYTYPTTSVPQLLEMRTDFFEDESPDQLLGIGCGGTRCNYDVNFCCGGFLFGTCLGQYDDDDLRCNSAANVGGAPYAQINYRLGPPCQWFNHGFVGGTCANNVYNPRIETFWRYTRGENCNAGNFIDLGTLNAGFSTITHFNSNECYLDDMPFPFGGRDVVYGFTVTQPVGLTINTCGPGNLNSDVYVLNNGCSMIYSNSGGCGTGSQVAQPFCVPGTYFVVVEGRNNSIGTFTLSISEDPNLVVRANAGPNVAVCQGLGVTMGAQLPATPASGGLPGYTYSWSPAGFLTSTTDSITIAYPPTTTQYILEVTDALGCVDRDTTIVTVNPGPQPNLGPNQTVCPGTVVNFNAGNGYTSYFWNNGAFTQQVNVSQPGQYIAVVADLNGCLGRDTVDLFNYANPNISLGNDTSICIGNSITLTTGGIYTNYAWNTGSSAPSITTGVGGNYQITVTDANGCVDRDTIIVNVDTLPIPNLPPAVSICPGATAVLNPGAGWPNYLWSTGSINQILLTNTLGPVSVTVTDGNGCQGTDNTNIINFNAPAGFNVTAPSNFLCDGQSVTITAGNSPAVTSYLWNTGATTNAITASAGGWYKVTVNDVNGCEFTDSIQITVLPNPVFDLGNDTTICAGSVLVYVAPPGMTYNWSTGSTTQTLVVNAPGTYSITLTNPNTTCFTIDQVVIGVAPTPTPTLPANASYCGGQTVNLDPGSGYTSYTWSNGANSQSINVGLPGTYTVTVTNATGCSATASSSVVGFAPVNVLVGGPSSGCLGSSITLNATSGFNAYNWSNGGTGSSLTVTAPGTYTVTVTDGNGCTGTASQTVTFNTPPTVSLGGTDTLCAGATTTLNAGAGFSNYAWSTGANTQSITVGNTGTYTVTVTDANGCTATDSKDLIGSTIAPVDLGPASLNICDNGSAILDAGPQYINYVWAPIASPNQYVIVNQPGTYNVTVTDQFGCTSSDNVTVTVNAVSPLDFMQEDTIGCAGQDLLLDAGDQWLQYDWNTGAPDQYLIVNTDGTYQVTVTDSSGCRFTDTIAVSFAVPPAMELGPNQDICPDQVISLDAGAGFDTYTWSNGSSTQTINVDAAGTYSVTVTYDICVVEDDILIGDNCPGRVFIPNVFTPNGDGINDVFELTHVNMEWLDISIYDRWGKFLYQSGDKNFKWNGTFNSKGLPEGVYYWVIEYKFTDSEVIFDDKGTITILR